MLQEEKEVKVPFKRVAAPATLGLRVSQPSQPSLGSLRMAARAPPVSRTPSACARDTRDTRDTRPQTGGRSLPLTDPPPAPTYSWNRRVMRFPSLLVPTPGHSDRSLPRAGLLVLSFSCWQISGPCLQWLQKGRHPTSSGRRQADVPVPISRLAAITRPVSS